MPTGIVQFFVESKDYGYIRVPETREEFFVHRRNTLEAIQKGDLVEFEIKETKFGIFADQVKKKVTPTKLS